MGRKSVAVLDVRSSEITVIVGERGVNDTFVFKANKSEEYDGYDESAFFNEERLSEAVIRAVSAAEQVCGERIKDLYVGVPGAYLMIDEETGENFDYTSSIDDSTYNKIKLTYDNEDTGFREVYIAQDGSNINRWGILQYFDTLSKGENGQAKADALLSLYNKKTRNLRITNAIGDNRVRAGSMVVVNLNLGDMQLKNWMLVEKCKHTYKQGEHWMDLTLRGGEFIG